MSLRNVLFLGCTVVCLAWNTRGAERPSLALSVEEAVHDLRDLEALYRASEEQGERVAVLQKVLERAAWLEQVGGMQDARADQLLALARLDGFKQAAAAVFHGFLPGEAGVTRADLSLRRPAAGELPKELQPLAKRIFYLGVRNRGSRELGISGVFADYRTRLERSRRGPTCRGKDLPEAAQAFAALFEFAGKIASGGDSQALVLLPETTDEVLALGLEFNVRAEAATLFARVLLPATGDSESLVAARRKAANIEEDILKERLKRHSGTPKPELTERKPPDPAVKPEEPQVVPPLLGVLERAGAGELMQCRLNDEAAIEVGKNLRVRREGKWVGKVQIAPGTTINAHKRVYWVQIVAGVREELVGGTVHPE